MSPKVNRLLVIGSVIATLTAFYPPNVHSFDDPVLNEQLVNQIRETPYGIKGQSSLVLRSKHVDDVIYRGSGLSSQFGFKPRGGIARQGFWVRLKNRGKGGWANGSVIFSKALNLDKYDSVVVWLRADEPNKKFRLTLEDEKWTNPEGPQSRSPIISTRGYDNNQILQYTIPFKKFVATIPLNFRKITQLGFEFGAKSVGNGKKGTVEVIGIAFVSQDSPLTNLHVSRVGAQTIATPPAPVKPKVKVAKKPVKAPVVMKQLAKPKAVVLEDFDIKSEMEKLRSERNKRKEAEKERAEKKAPPLKAKTKEVQNNLKENSLATSAEEKAEPKSTSSFSKNLLSFLGTILVFILGLGLLVGLAFLVRWLIQNKKRLGARKKNIAVFHEIKWPFNTPDKSAGHTSLSLQKQFWRQQAEKGIQFGWLSAFYKSLLQEPDEDYHGEKFLIRQTKLAREEGITLIPSLCFVRSIFHYDKFLANPELYLFKPVPPNEHHLSDEELRVKYIGHFPIWVPPFWQKQHKLPQRVLVSYGKMPGALFSNDSVQYNLTSTELKKMAINTIRSFASKGAVGVRIEGASSLLNSSIEHFWEGQFPPINSAPEFWKDVIREIKSDYPRFLFIADSVGLDLLNMQKMGFDYFGNDRIQDVLVNQIRLENVVPVNEILRGVIHNHLQNSLYEIESQPTSSSPNSASQSQETLSLSLSSLLPGKAIITSQTPSSLRQFLKLISTWPALRSSSLKVLPTQSESVFSFARWSGKHLLLVTANFSLSTRESKVRIDPFAGVFRDNKMYLFNDALHGSAILREIKDDSSNGPSVAILGKDLKESGIPFSLPGLSLKILSLSFDKSFVNTVAENQSQTEKVLTQVQ